MELLTAVARLAAILIVLTGACAAILYGLMRLSEIDEARHAEPEPEPYDWQAEGDFAPPAHNPLMSITARTVTVRCTCGNFTHVEPIKFTTASAYRACEDEFWGVHNREVAA